MKIIEAKSPVKPQKTFGDLQFGDVFRFGKEGSTWMRIQTTKDGYNNVSLSNGTLGTAVMGWPVISCNATLTVEEAA